MDDPNALKEPQARATMSSAITQATSVNYVEAAHQRQTDAFVQAQQKATNDASRQKTSVFIQQKNAEAQQTATAYKTRQIGIENFETAVSATLTVSAVDITLAENRRRIDELSKQQQMEEILQQATRAIVTVEINHTISQRNVELQSQISQAEFGRNSEWWRSLWVNIFYSLWPIALALLVGYVVFKSLQLIELWVRSTNPLPMPQSQSQQFSNLPALPAGYVIVREEELPPVTTPLLGPGDMTGSEEQDTDEEDPLAAGRELELPDHVEEGMMPMGTSEFHPGGWWASIQQLDSVLVAGTRRMGKTNLIKCWIESFIRQRGIQMILADGKQGIEFGQYQGVQGCEVVYEGLTESLKGLYTDIDRRFGLLKQYQVASIDDYNALPGIQLKIPRIILIIDELMYIFESEPDAEDVLVDLIARGGALGIHAILATQHPTRHVITSRIKANLGTRIALPVASGSDSRVILDRSGAEVLPKVPGRYLTIFEARLLQVQAYRAPKIGSWRKRLSYEEAPSPPSTPEEVLSPVELTMIEAALANGRRFVIDTVKEATVRKGYTVAKSVITQTAKEWERLGLLAREEVGPDVGSRSASRIVTEEMIEIYLEHGGKMPILT